MSPAVWSVVPCTRQHELDGLRAEWDELWARAEAATPFQDHAWMSAWARHHVTDGHLRVLALRRDGRLVAVAPFHRDVRGPWPVLSLLGGAVSDVSDVLVEPGFTDWDRLTAGLRTWRDWCTVDLTDVLPSGVVHGWIEGWPGQETRWDASVFLDLPVDPADPVAHLLDRIPGRTANTLRRKLRKVAGAGVNTRHVPVGEVAPAVDRFLRLHEEQWAGRGVVPAHLTPEFRGFLVEALTRMLDRETAVLTEFSVDGRVLLSQVDLVGHGVLAYYLAGISPDLRALLDTSCLIVSHDTALAVERGATRYCMLRGEEDYKQRWRPEATRSSRVLLARPGPTRGWGHPQAARLRVVGGPWWRAARARWADLVRRARRRGVGQDA